MNKKVVYRTVPATAGLVNTEEIQRKNIKYMENMYKNSETNKGYTEN